LLASKIATTFGMSPSAKEIVRNKVRNQAGAELEAVEQDSKGFDVSA